MRISKRRKESALKEPTTPAQDGQSQVAQDGRGSKASRRGRKSPSGTRARILTLTRSLIAQGGLSAVKARKIADEADVSVGTIYNMFGPLDDLVRQANAETYDALFIHQRAALDAARSEESAPRHHLQALANAYLDWVRDNHVMWAATLAFNRERHGEAPDWYREKEVALLQIVEDALGDFENGPRDEARAILARALWSSIHGIVSNAMGAKALLVPEENIRAQMHLIVNAIGEQLLS